MGIKRHFPHSDIIQLYQYIGVRQLTLIPIVHSEIRVVLRLKSSTPSFHSDGFGEIARLVDIGPFQDRDVIRE